MKRKNKGQPAVKKNIKKVYESKNRKELKEYENLVIHANDTLTTKGKTIVTVSNKPSQLKTAIVGTGFSRLFVGIKEIISDINIEDTNNDLQFEGINFESIMNGLNTDFMEDKHVAEFRVVPVIAPSILIYKLINQNLSYSQISNGLTKYKKSNEHIINEEELFNKLIEYCRE